MADDYDSPWKEAIERYFADFMGFYFPDAHAQIDWAQPLVFLDQELRAALRDAELGKRVVDKLVRVTRSGGGEEWIFIHLEIQGTPQAGFAERMFVYHSRLFDRYRKPIASLALLADAQPGWRPTNYAHENLGCRVSMRFPVAKLLDWAGSEARLEDSRNPFALMTLAHLATRATRHDPSARYSAKWRVVKQLYHSGLDRQQIVDLFIMIDWMMHLPQEQARLFWNDLVQLEEERKMRYVTSIERFAREEGLAKGRAEGIAAGMQEGIQQGIQEGIQQGMQQGMQEGRRTGKCQVIRQQLASRFGELPAWANARLDVATETELDEWTTRLLSAGSLEAVFGLTRQ